MVGPALALEQIDQHRAQSIPLFQELQRSPAIPALRRENLKHGYGTHDPRPRHLPLRLGPHPRLQ